MGKMRKHLGVLAGAILVLGFASIASAAPVAVQWAANPPEDGVVGYILCYGNTSRSAGGFTSYTTEVDVGNVTTTTIDLANPDLTWYLAVISYDAAGYRSSYSPEYVWSASSLLRPTRPGGIRLVPKSP